MLEEGIKNKDANKKRYVYLNKFNEYKEDTDKKLEHLHDEVDSLFSRFNFFTIILLCLAVAIVAKYIFL